MARYQSEFTRFIEEFKHQHREIEQRQREGRALLWDKPQDAALQREFDHAELSSKRAGY